MKMDHFEQGLKGSMKSMIAGNSFENFLEMYQWAVKIAGVLEGTERENKATNLGKRKFEYGNWEPKGGSPKRFDASRAQDKGK